MMQRSILSARYSTMVCSVCCVMQCPQTPRRDKQAQRARRTSLTRQQHNCSFCSNNSQQQETNDAPTHFVDMTTNSSQKCVQKIKTQETHRAQAVTLACSKQKPRVSWKPRKPCSNPNNPKHFPLRSTTLRRLLYSETVAWSSNLAPRCSAGAQNVRQRN